MFELGKLYSFKNIDRYNQQMLYWEDKEKLKLSIKDKNNRNHSRSLYTLISTKELCMLTEIDLSNKDFTILEFTRINMLCESSDSEKTFFIGLNNLFKDYFKYLPIKKIKGNNDYDSGTESE